MVQETLADKPYRLWGGDESVTTGLVCLFVPKCMHCGTNMEYWSSELRKFEINDDTDKKNSHALDIVMWCPECGHINLFGVAISKEHYEFIQRRLKFLPHKKVPYPPTII